MTTETWPEVAVDEPAFTGLAERHRRELHVHCYRMLGSFEDAEDTVQETFLRAWRARAGMRQHLPAERQDWTGGDGDAGTRALVRRFTDASVAKDPGAIAAMLRDDVRCSMPPTPGVRAGRDAVVADWVRDGFESLGRMRAVPTAVNRQPAVGFYLWREGAYRPLTVDVLRICGGAIAEIVTFGADEFPRLGLPTLICT